jgi:hypothetical protein
MDVTVRATNPDLAQALGRDVPAFVEKLERNGFDAEMQPARRDERQTEDQGRKHELDWWEERQNRRHKQPFWETEYDD